MIHLLSVLILATTTLKDLQEQRAKIDAEIAKLQTDPTPPAPPPDIVGLATLVKSDSALVTADATAVKGASDALATAQAKLTADQAKLDKEKQALADALGLNPAPLPVPGPPVPTPPNPAPVTTASLVVITAGPNQKWCPYCTTFETQIRPALAAMPGVTLTTVLYNDPQAQQLYPEARVPRFVLTRANGTVEKKVGLMALADFQTWIGTK